VLRRESVKVGFANRCGNLTAITLALIENFDPKGVSENLATLNPTNVDVIIRQFSV